MLSTIYALANVHSGHNHFILNTLHTLVWDSNSDSISIRVASAFNLATKKQECQEEKVRIMVLWDHDKK